MQPKCHGEVSNRGHVIGNWGSAAHSGLSLSSAYPQQVAKAMHYSWKREREDEKTPYLYPWTMQHLNQPAELNGPRDSW